MDKHLPLAAQLGLTKVQPQTGEQLAGEYLAAREVETSAVVASAIHSAVEHGETLRPDLACPKCAEFAAQLGIQLSVNDKGQTLALRPCDIPKGTDLHMSITVECGDGTQEGSIPKVFTLASHLRYHNINSIVRSVEFVLNAQLRQVLREETTALRGEIFSQPGLDKAKKEDLFKAGVKMLREKLPWQKCPVEQVKAALREKEPRKAPRPRAISKLNPDSQSRVQDILDMLKKRQGK